MTAVVEATDLGFTYRHGRVALAGIDLAAGEGEALGVMGPNGSGKSTLLRLLALSFRPGTGQVRVVPDRRATAVVFDRLPFAESLSGRENVSRQLALRGRYPRDAGPDVDPCLQALGLAERARDPVSTYSAGMRRRLALVEALAGRPSLLLLDEPTLGLDPEGRTTLASLLRAVVDEGRTVVLASNEPDFVAPVCDRVILLHEGRVVGEGPPAELIAGLGKPVVIEVEPRRAPCGPADDDLPPGVTRIPGHGGVLRFTADAGSASLPALCGWLAGHAVEPRAIRIREPDLADVFLSLTGVPLRDPGRPEASSK